MTVTNHSEASVSLKDHVLRIGLLYGAIATIILMVLYFISLRNYILFHGIVELAGIAVAFSIFIIVWNTRRDLNDDFFLIVGISFLFIGGIDLVHTLAYKGMGVFPGNNADLPTQLWIAARYFQSITFLIATLFIGRSITKNRKYDAGIVITACTAVCTLLFLSIFVWQNFPQCFVEGSGLTPFKIASEYIISLILIATIVILYRKREHFDPAVWHYLIAAQAFLIMGELAFTSYISVYGFTNMLGHLFRLVSVYLFYRAFVVISLTRPYDLILRELRQDELHMQESEKKYRTLFENMLEGFAYCRMIYDDNGEAVDWEYLAVNNAFEKITGLKGITGKRVLDAIPNVRELTPELFDTYGRVASTGIPEMFEIDFTPLKMWLKISVFSPEKGYFVAVFEDVTTRKRAEDKMRNARDFYLKILDDFPNPIWRADVNAKCDYFNRDWLMFTGRTLEQELGDGWAAGVHPDDLDRCLKIFLDHFHARQPFEMEYRLRYHDGTYHWLYDSGKPFYTLDGVFAGFIGSCYDIQDRKLAEDALRQVNKKLNLLSSITRHDIRNQLMALNAYIALSEEAIGKPVELKEFIGKEQKIADSIARQITFTKDYENLGVLSPVWQNVSALVRDAGTALPMRNIILETRCPGLEVYADPLLEKVFYNLIENSLQYGGERMTKICVTANERDEKLLITYEDDGSGISEYDKRELFTKGFGKHTGLGLYLSREILSITGITITETGETDRGARFEIVVPKGAYRFTDR